MPQLSHCLDRFSASPIAEIFELAGRLAAEGRTIYDLSSGEPDFVTEAFICDAAHAAIDNGDTKYTATDGSAEMKAAIARHLTRHGHRQYCADEIVVGNGAKPLIGNILMAILNEGDEVVIPGPCWSSHPGAVLALGNEPVVVDCPASDGFKLTPSRLREALSDRTRLFLLCNPNNPTGVYYDASEQAALAEVLADYPDVWILADEIYSDLVFDGAEHLSFVVAAPGLADRSIILNGLSKGYAMTGWRIGYAAGPAEVMRATRKIMSHMAGSPSSMGQAAAIAALDGPQTGLAARRDMYQQRRDAVLEWLAPVPQLKIPVPKGAFYVYVDCSGVIGQRTQSGDEIRTSADLARYFLDTAGVAVVPGEAFESGASFRMSIASSMEVLQGACKGIVNACEAMS